MNLYRVVAVACVVLIAGCSTPGDIRKKSPALDLNSVKNAKAVAGCISDGLEAFIARGINTRPTSNGYTVWIDEDAFSGKDTALVVDITDTQSGSNTRFYSNMAWHEEKATKVIRDCQGNLPVEAAASPASTESETPTPMNASVSQKLRELQALRKDGLITEEEYQKKKQQLLEKL